MFVKGWDDSPYSVLSPVGLCNLVEFEYQIEIRASCRMIEIYLSAHPEIKEVSIAVSEMTQLVFGKLEDELIHLFLKETGIVFPRIKKKYSAVEKPAAGCLDTKVFETVHHTHQLIIDLTQKIRVLLNNYAVNPDWSQEWTECIREMIALENKIFLCIHVEENLLYPKVTGCHFSDTGSNDLTYHLN
jgi:iron-sulfur cluster repair protein YtfE (RIC family)